MRYHYNVFNLNISNGLIDKELEVQGDKFIYSTGTNQIQVKLDDISNDAIPLNPKDQIVAPFKKIYISAGAYAETIKCITLGPAEIEVRSNLFNADKINELVLVDSVTNVNNVDSVTNVSNVDSITEITNDIPNYKDSINGNAFCRTVIMVPTAGNYGIIQIFNPATSPKTSIITSLNSGGRAIDFNIDFYNTPIDTVAIDIANKNNGLPPANTVAYKLDSTVNILGSQLINTSNSAYSDNVIQDKPLVLPPGTGIIIRTAVSVSLVINVELIEV